MINKLEEGQFYVCNYECILSSLICCFVEHQNRFPSFLVNCTARDFFKWCVWAVFSSSDVCLLDFFTPFYGYFFLLGNNTRVSAW